MNDPVIHRIIRCSGRAYDYGFTREGKKYRIYKEQDSAGLNHYLCVPVKPRKKKGQTI